MSRATGRPNGRCVVQFGLLGTLIGVAPLSAQKITESRWSMAEARGGFCVWYLLDPAMAPGLAEKGTLFTPAGTGSSIGPKGHFPFRNLYF